MKKSSIPIIVIILVIVLGGLLAFAKNGSHQSEISNNTTPPAANIKQDESNAMPVPPQAMPEPGATPPPAKVSPPPAKGVFTGEEAIEGNDVQVQQISYDGDKFTPSTLTIKVGDIIVFKNQSKASFWPASNPHPTHTDYSELDPKQPISAGKTFQFKFTKVGTWGFHDHLNPRAYGKINVTQ